MFAWGVNPAHAKSHFSSNGTVQVYLVGSNIPANILWPGDKARFTLQFANLTDKAVAAKGRMLVIQYETFTYPDNVFHIGLRKVADVGEAPIEIALDPKGWQDVVVEPTIPERFGGYAVIVALEGQDRLFGAACVRTFKPERKPRQFYKLTMDLGEIDALTRLGAAPNRVGIGYKPTTDRDFQAWFEKESGYLRELKAAGLPVTIEFGAGAFQHECQPLGRPRPWLDEKDRMLDTKMDWAWLPSWDPDFKRFVKRFVTEFGWPKGPVNAIKLWNEPWNGISISGWGADDERYREIYTAMAEGLEEARRESGVQVLIGGCDSSSNTFDKLFGDGTDRFLKWLDFLSIHYQGTDPYTTVKRWVDRRGPDGQPDRVRVWDTESWVANSDDRIAGVLAAMYSFGQERVVGINSDCMVTAVQWRKVRTANGEEKRKILQTWSAGASVGAFQHFVGERNFRELLFKNGLPFVMVFDGEKGPEDATVVVLGDMGHVFGYDNVIFRTCRSLEERKKKDALRQRLAALPADAPERKTIEEQLARPMPYEGATMTLAADGETFSLYDFYGNKIAAKDGRIVIPLDARGFYLRGDGSEGAFAALIEALRRGRIEGLEPLAKECLDLTAPIDKRPVLRLRLTNVLNRPIQGSFDAKLGALQIEYPRTLEFAAHETKVVEAKVTGGAASPDNLYPLSFVFDAGTDGRAVHAEEMRVNLIARRAIVADGRLDDWKDVLPQPIRVEGVQEATLTEKAWLPFLAFDESIKKGFAVGYLAYDERHFHFAAKITDATPHPGTVRFETRDETEYFYPEVAYTLGGAGGCAEHFSVRWTGRLTAPHDDEFTVYTRSDDGVRMWLDGKQVIDDWRGHGPERNEAKIRLAKGQSVELKLEYFQGGGGGMVQLGWEGPKTPGGIIPTACLSGPDGAPGLLGEYFSGTNFGTFVQKRTDPRIDFGHWPGRIGDPDFGTPKPHPMKWPEGVRRFSYRRNPVLPCGNAPNFDNVQIAFNVLPAERKPLYECPPGTMPKYTGYSCTDYEYAMNQVAPAYGGGTEIWRLRVPGMPHKHFYPRQPASPKDGPVKDGRLVMTHEGGTRIVECSIPWTELPDVKARLDAGETVKFTFRVNDDAGVGCMELSKGRSVAKRNNSFRADWVEHWANELEFGFEK